MRSGPFPHIGSDNKWLHYRGFYLGYATIPRYISTGDGDSETSIVDYKACWKRIGVDLQWRWGHIYVNRVDKTVELAKWCIDFILVLEHQEFILGRKLTSDELADFRKSLTSLKDMVF